MTDRVTILHTGPAEFPRWKHYYDRLPIKSIYASPEYIRLLERHSGDEAELFVAGDEERYIYYPYFKKRLDKLPFAFDAQRDLSQYYDIVSSWYYGGPLFSAADHDGSLAVTFIDRFTDHAGKNNFVSGFMRFDPSATNHLPFQGLLTMEQDRETVYLDLQKPIEEIVCGFTGSNIRNIKRAEREGILAVPTDAENDWMDFGGIYQQEMVRKKAPSHLHFSDRFFQSMRVDMRGNCKLIKASYRGKNIGGFLMLHDERCAFHFLSASLPEYWNKRVNNLLFYEAVVLARSMQIPVFDFMGGRPGVFRFKSQFSRAQRCFFVAKTVYDGALYGKLCRWSGAKDEQYFPPYRWSERLPPIREQ